MKYKHDTTVPASKCPACAYLAGRRSAFRSIAREARRQARPLQRMAGVPDPTIKGIACGLTTISRIAMRRARGAS